MENVAGVAKRSWTTLLAGKGSSVRIRHAPPGIELKPGARSDRVPDFGRLDHNCRGLDHNCDHLPETTCSGDLLVTTHFGGTGGTQAARFQSQCTEVERGCSCLAGKGLSGVRIPDAPPLWVNSRLAVNVSECHALNRKLQRFITLLMLTRRLRPSADYLVARRHELGPLLARMDPLSHATFTATALEIGFSSQAIQYRWAALAHVCAFSGIGPQEVQHAHIDATRSALAQAAARQGRGPMQFFHSSIFDLEATLFHAGVTTELPRRQSPTKAAQRAAALTRWPAGHPPLSPPFSPTWSNSPSACVLWAVQVQC